jgi:hypothetical protein
MGTYEGICIIIYPTKKADKTDANWWPFNPRSTSNPRNRAALEEASKSGFYRKKKREVTYAALLRSMPDTRVISTCNRIILKYSQLTIYMSNKTDIRMSSFLSSRFSTFILLAGPTSCDISSEP